MCLSESARRSCPLGTPGVGLLMFGEFISYTHKLGTMLDRSVNVREHLSAEDTVSVLVAVTTQRASLTNEGLVVAT